MKFPVVEVKGIRTDLKKKKIHLAFDVRLDDENYRLAQALAMGADFNNGMASLDVDLAQSALPGLSARVVEPLTGEIEE
jgi:hypothetical protein